MQALKKSIHDMETRLAHNRLQAHQQTQQLKTMLVQKASDPKVLLGGLAVGVLLGLLRGKRHTPDAVKNRKFRYRPWLRAIKMLAPFAPDISAAVKAFRNR